MICIASMSSAVKPVKKRNDQEVKSKNKLKETENAKDAKQQLLLQRQQASKSSQSLVRKLDAKSYFVGTKVGELADAAPDVEVFDSDESLVSKSDKAEWSDAPKLLTAIMC